MKDIQNGENKMTPKEKALEGLLKKKWYRDSVFLSVDVEEAIDIALKEQAKEYDEMIMKAPLGLKDKTILLNIIKSLQNKSLK